MGVANANRETTPFAEPQGRATRDFGSLTMPDENPLLETNPVLEPFADFWNEYVEHGNESAKQFFASIDGQEDLEALRQKWLKTMSQSMEAYLRSPAFLQAMKHNTDMLIRMKNQTDQAAKEFARNAGIPTVDDISGLFERLHTIEHAILERLSQIDQRLAAMDEKIRDVPRANDQVTWGI